MKSFHISKLSVTECSDNNQNRATGGKFDITETFIRGRRHRRPLSQKKMHPGNHSEAQKQKITGR